MTTLRAKTVVSVKSAGKLDRISLRMVEGYPVRGYVQQRGTHLNVGCYFLSTVTRTRIYLTFGRRRII